MRKTCMACLLAFCLCAFSVPVFAADEPPPELLADVREASEKFQFCFKSDADVYKLFAEHFPSYDASQYDRFFVSIPTGSVTIYFIPDDCTFSGTASVLRFDKPCLRLVYGFTSQNYVTNVIQPTTYFSSGNTSFRNFDVTVDDTVLLASNIDYFYAVNVSSAPEEPPEPPQGDNHDAYIAIIFVVSALLGAELARSFSFWKW